LLVPISAYAAPGDLYEVDSSNGSIVIFTPTGAKTTFASGLNSPFGAAFDSSGNLFVGDGNTGSFDGSIYKFALTVPARPLLLPVS